MEIAEEKKQREHAGRKEKQNAYEEWVNSIRGKIPASSSHPCNPETAIFRVPEHIRRGNEDAYEPWVVSIGPYHRAREKFVDKHKWHYVQAILQRNPSKSLEDYLNGIKELEDSARSCYRETTEIQKIESNDFVEIMFVDGCFLVELFLKRLDRITCNKDTGHQDDIIYSDRLLHFYLRCDLCLLENQLPFSILECIFKSVRSKQVNDPATFSVSFATEFDQSLSFEEIRSLDKDSKSFSYEESPSSDKANCSARLTSLAITLIPSVFGHNVAVGEEESFHHLLHLFHQSLIPHPFIEKTPARSTSSRLCSHVSTSFAGVQAPAKSMFKKLKSVIASMFGSAFSSGETAPSKFPYLRSLPSVTTLDNAGVKFRKAKNPSSILNIKFECGVMKIPHLFIGDSANFFFRNLIAFEQCRRDVPQYFSMYAVLMDCLINTPKDIEILSQHGIIEHWLGSNEEVALLFNRLGKGILVDFDDPYLSNLFKDVNNYCSKCWPRSRATLCRDYFSSPWATLSVAAAFILLLLTAIQTFCSVFPR